MTDALSRQSDVFARRRSPDESGAVRFFFDVREAEPPKTFLSVQG